MQALTRTCAVQPAAQDASKPGVTTCGVSNRGGMTSRSWSQLQRFHSVLGLRFPLPRAGGGKNARALAKSLNEYGLEVFIVVCERCEKVSGSQCRGRPCKSRENREILQ